VSALDAIRMARAAGGKLSVDGPSLVLDAETPPPAQVFELLRAHKPQVLELLRAERRAVVQYLNDHFQSSPLGRCAHCGGAGSPADPYAVLFCGTDRAELHAGCYRAWIALREAEARAALGIEMPAESGVEPDAAQIETGAQ
jgi:hypothetical protein